MSPTKGAPTNQELQVDFGETSRELFIAAYQQAMGGPMHPAIYGKPLVHLVFRAERQHRLTDPPHAIFHKESLQTVPLTSDVAQTFEFYEPTRNYPDHVLDYYERVATRIGRTALTPNLDIAAVLPPGSLIATYKEELTGHANQHTGTLDPRPTKHLLTNAIALAKDTQAQMQSWSDHMAARQDGLIDSDVPYNRGNIRHSLTFWMTHDLPLNGNEPLAFLEAYHKSVLETAMFYRGCLQRSKQVAAQRQNRTLYTAYTRAARRAAWLIDKQTKDL